MPKKYINLNTTKNSPLLLLYSFPPNIRVQRKNYAKKNKKIIFID